MLLERLIWKQQLYGGIDPGVREAFVASYGDGIPESEQRKRHRIRKASTSEYYQMAGYKHDRTHPVARALIAQTPSTKTTDLVRFSEVLQYIFRNFAAMSGHYTII